MNLTKFLLESAQSHAREEILKHKLLFDLKVAAAECGYHLQNYHSDVDHDGFDLVLDDGVNLRKVQLKSVGRKAKAAKWEIHRGLLRPTANNLEALGFQYKHPEFNNDKICWGVEGGVILIRYEVNGSKVDVTYLYTDAYIISAISLGLIKKGKPTMRVADTVRQDLPEKKANAKLKISRGLFVKAATPAHLLYLLGMENEIKRDWQFRVRALASDKWGPKGVTLANTLKEYRSEFPAIMVGVCGDSSP